jgi:hypothetical protein
MDSAAPVPRTPPSPGPNSVIGATTLSSRIMALCPDTSIDFFNTNANLHHWILLLPGANAGHGYEFDN